MTACPHYDHQYEAFRFQVLLPMTLRRFQLNAELAPNFLSISIFRTDIGVTHFIPFNFRYKILAFGKVGTSTSPSHCVNPRRDQNVNASLTLHQYLLSLILTLVSYQLTKILLLHQSFVVAFHLIC